MKSKINTKDVNNSDTKESSINNIIRKEKQTTTTTTQRKENTEEKKKEGESKIIEKLNSAIGLIVGICLVTAIISLMGVAYVYYLITKKDPLKELDNLYE
ncbi:MAG: hypothetical protein ACP5UN_01185 [Candidatus Micrarchaeia archaeon]